MPSLDKQTRQLINYARTLGSGSLSVYLEDSELLRLCCVIAHDMARIDLIADLNIELPSSDYFTIPANWFASALSSSVSFSDLFLQLQMAIPDFPTYFGSLCELHKRRLKYQKILRYQPFPHWEQIQPRSLLEYGWFPKEALAPWLVWRKWLYDLDNRSAQETGYLFEPILAAAIGGASYSATKSPIRRADNPVRGRQVDCLDGKLAYEFKMRVTIAASGQGRFSEELAFAKDCAFSGYIPVLLVLDATPSSRLDELIDAYQEYGGQVYLGETAWQHIAEKAGWAMGQFVEKYIHAPFLAIGHDETGLPSLSLQIEGNQIIVQIAQTQMSIPRFRADDIVEMGWGK